MGEPIQALTTYLSTIDDINSAASVLAWDQRTYMPPGGAEARANQLTTLSRLAHEYSTSDELGCLLDSAAAALAEPAGHEAALVRVARRNFERSRKLPPELVADLTRTASQANSVWQQARAESNFPIFAPFLEHVVDLMRQAVDHLGYTEHPYDALLDEYEPGMTTAQVRSLFGELQAGLVPLVQAIAERQHPDDDKPLHQPFDADKQIEFGWKIVQDLGFDTARGRQDKTAHPFCISFGPDDVRITTRVYPEFLSPALFGTLHETGHGLYEQGIDPRFARGPLGNGASLGVHESQSRMWENLIGRSRPFWQKYYPVLQQTFPQLTHTSLDQFYKAVNTVKPSYIRVEADEVTYNLHILLRFEFELAMLDGSLAVRDLPEAWGAKMQELLGIVPPNDALGCLQDIHWSSGLYGYFPTYTIGNVLSVQLWEAALRDRAELRDELARADYTGLLSWMREHIHRHGALAMPNDLIQRTTGAALTARPYLAYLERKFGELYQL